ncbi:MAG: phosphatidylserine/phosphatidylglycerophosphate/cardiolipin synthase family protein [Pseudobdellovibrio sp.]|nr:phosphatidylserine/phosphatidylglycerophosphate/cardiolipin synthase family protein [Pseudobdellovibrio sp.]
MAVQNWSDVKFYFSGDGYFSSVLESIHQAVYEIRVEMYMFNFDELGKKILQSLKEARERGVKVYLLVDGIGTIGFLGDIDSYCKANNINFKVYHPLPIRLNFLRRFSLKDLTWKNIRRFFLMFRKLNNRDHRKVFLIDQKVAFVGSQNINNVHSEEISQNKAWRDTGVEVRGAPIETLVSTSQFAWERAKPNKLTEAWSLHYNVLRLSARRKHRLVRLRKLIQSFNEAQTRIWITTAYFLPNRKTVQALARAARRGVDVNLCLPAISDMPFMKWTAWLLYDRLLKAGVKIYEYQDRILHAKSMIVDQWGTVGSYNFNHRSLIHDLEVEVVIDQQEWLEKLEKQWRADVAQSKMITLEDKGHSNIFLRIIANIFYWFRYWL